MKRLLAFMLAFGAIVLSGLMNYANTPTECKVPRPPVVTVSYNSQPVRYDTSKSTRELSALHSDTVNPYGSSVRTTTEGIRFDRPSIETKTTENMLTYPMQKLFCISLDTVDIHIEMKPVIYIASQWPPGACRDAILGHEEKHVRVDHEIMDDFVPELRRTVRAEVDRIGAMGPLNLSQQDSAQTLISEKIKTVVQAETSALHAMMLQRQSRVDTLQEYERVGAICHPGR